MRKIPRSFNILPTMRATVVLPVPGLPTTRICRQGGLTLLLRRDSSMCATISSTLRTTFSIPIILRSEVIASVCSCT